MCRHNKSRGVITLVCATQCCIRGLYNRCWGVSIWDQLPSWSLSMNTYPQVVGRINGLHWSICSPLFLPLSWLYLYSLLHFCCHSLSTYPLWHWLYYILCWYGLGTPGKSSQFSQIQYHVILYQYIMQPHPPLSFPLMFVNETSSE